MVNAPAGLASGTGLAGQPVVAINAVNAQLATAAGLAGLPAVNVTSNVFPNTRLGVRVDLNLGGVWTDITQYVYQRNPLQITNMGRADWTATIQPAQLSLTVNNRDGRFTPKNTAGAYYPNITRNVQIRVFLSATSTAGQSYAGFRFYGEVSEWPVVWDPSGRDVAVNMVASGIWRRVSQQQTTLGSAFRRYVTNGPAVQAYWPCEDGTGSGQLVPFASPAGTPNAIQQFAGGQAGLSLAASSPFHGSDAIVVLNGAKIIATVPAGGTPTNNQVRFVISVPAAGDSGTGSTSWNLVEVDTAGTVKKLELYLMVNGTLSMQGRDNQGGIILAATTTTVVKGQSYLVSMELTPGGNFALRIIPQSAGGITESVLGTLASVSVGAISQVIVNRAYALMDTAFGHLYVSYGSPQLMVPAANALGGYVGEKALDRFTRICAEQGITTETIGTASSSASLGPQVDDTLANLLQSIEDTDCGLLYETTDQFGIGYRTNTSMANQAAAVVFNYQAAIIDQSLAPVYDDQLTRNNVTVTNWTGAAQQAILTIGPMSILNPPNGIGNGYVYTRNVTTAADTQLPGIATFLLNQGAVDEVRIPVVSIKMVRPNSAPFFNSVPALRIGDYFQITNPPSFLTGSTVKQLVWGHSETLNAKEWTLAFNTVPETPWETGFSAGTIQTAQIPGGSPVSSQASGTTGLASLVANGSITPSMLNQGITIRTLSGAAVTISINPPGNPNVNDIWINSTTGLLSQWNGSSWAPILFNATNTIQAGTIISSLIAAGTIVAGNIAVGTITAATGILSGVFAGIVNATTITGATIVDTGGGYFGYTGTPAANNMFFSAVATSGTDSSSNAYLAGVTFYGNPQVGLWIAANMNVASGDYGITYYSASSEAGPWSADSWMRRSGPSSNQIEIGPVVEIPSSSINPTTPAAGAKYWTPSGGASPNTPRLMKVDGAQYGIGEANAVLPSDQTISTVWATAIAAGGVNLNSAVISGIQYWFEALIQFQHGATFTAGDTDAVGFTGPTVSQCSWFAHWSASATPPAGSTTGYVGMSTLTHRDLGAGGANFFQYFHAWGSFTPSANGTFSAAAGLGTGSHNFTVLNGTYLKIRTAF